MIKRTEIVYPASVKHSKEYSNNLTGGAIMLILYGIMGMDMFEVVPYVNIVRPFLLFVTVVMLLGTAVLMRVEMWLKQSDRCVYRYGGDE